MTDNHRRIVQDLEADARDNGLEHHLEAAQALAREGVDAATIEGMMRFMYSPKQIQALIAQASEIAIR